MEGKKDKSRIIKLENKEALELMHQSKFTLLILFLKKINKPGKLLI